MDREKTWLGLFDLYQYNGVSQLRNLVIPLLLTVGCTGDDGYGSSGPVDTTKGKVATLGDATDSTTEGGRGVTMADTGDTDTSSGSSSTTQQETGGNFCPTGKQAFYPDGNVVPSNFSISGFTSTPECTYYVSYTNNCDDILQKNYCDYQVNGLNWVCNVEVDLKDKDYMECQICVSGESGDLIEGPEECKTFHVGK